MYATYVSGNAYEFVGGIAVTEAGEVVIAGMTESTDFPVTPGTFGQSSSGAREVFVASLAADGSDLVASTYMGGSYWEEAHGVAFDENGSVIVAGLTHSGDFPVSDDAMYGPYGGANRTFVARFSPDLNDLEYSTTLEGTGGQGSSPVVVGPDGAVFLSGTAGRTGPPFPLGVFSTAPNGSDAFVVKVRLGAAVHVTLNISADPEGVAYRVDGSPYSANESFNWSEGSAHTVDAESPQVIGNDTYIFANWSDGGSQNHSVSAGTVASIEARFVRLEGDVFVASFAPKSGGADNASEVTVLGGQSASVVIHILAGDAYSGAGVQVALADPPEGFTGSCAPALIQPPGNCTFTIQVARGVAAGPHTLTVRATDANLSHDLPMQVTVIAGEPPISEPWSPVAQYAPILLIVAAVAAAVVILRFRRRR